MSAAPGRRRSSPGRSRFGRRHVGARAGRPLRGPPGRRPVPGRLAGARQLEPDGAAVAWISTGPFAWRTSSRPVLDLGFRAEQFRALDVRNFLTFTGTGGLRLRGPLFQSTLTRRSDGQQRRALLRRPGEQADHRSGRPYHRRSGRHHLAPPGKPRGQVPEPFPRFAHHSEISESSWAPTSGFARLKRTSNSAARYSSARPARPTRPREPWTRFAAAIP